MNATKAKCGHLVLAEGAPGSMARRACESRHCGLPRCESELPAKFSDRECAAYVWLHRCGISGWMVDLATKKVEMCLGNDEVQIFTNLVDAAKYHGWEG